MRSLVLAFAFAGCAVEVPAAPQVYVRAPYDPMLPVYTAGPDAWSPLGFEAVTDDPGTPECARDWYVHRTTDCKITMWIYRVPDLVETAGTQAQTDPTTRAVSIDSRLVDPLHLQIAVAHEAGHILLDTPRHTQGGIMGGADCVMHDVDYQLACETIGYCVKY